MKQTKKERMMKEEKYGVKYENYETKKEKNSCHPPRICSQKVTYKFLHTEFIVNLSSRPGSTLAVKPGMYKGVLCPISSLLP